MWAEGRGSGQIEPILEQDTHTHTGGSAQIEPMKHDAHASGGGRGVGSGGENRATGFTVLRIQRFLRPVAPAPRSRASAANPGDSESPTPGCSHFTLDIARFSSSQL